MPDFTITVSDVQIEPLLKWKTAYDAEQGGDPTTNAEFAQIAWDTLINREAAIRAKRELKNAAAKYNTLTTAEQAQVQTLIDTLASN